MTGDRRGLYDIHGSEEHLYMTPEHELDANMQRTGRSRRTQFVRTMRYQAVPPSQRTTMPWDERGEAER